MTDHLLAFETHRARGPFNAAFFSLTGPYIEWNVRGQKARVFAGLPGTAWTFEGCSCERDLAGLLRAAGFARVDLEPYRLHSPFLTFNTQIAGVAHA